MQIEETPVESVKPYAGNPRRNETAVAKVAASIREFGFRQPIVVDEKMVVIAGHTRLAAAKVLGLTTVPVHIAHGLSPEKVRAYRLADNRTNEEAEWDFDKLRAELEGLKLDGVDLSSTGFDEDEIARALAEGGEGLTDPDEVPEAPARAVTVQGDTWILGKHRLRCGDSTSTTDVEALLAGVSPHLMVTDPPYGVNYDPEWRTRAGLAGEGSAKGKVLNDDKADWREAWALFPGDVVYVWHAGLFAGVVADSLVACGFKLRSQIIWAKNHLAIGRGDYHWQHEPCWYAVREKATGHYGGDRKQTTLWKIDKPQKSETGHGTQKPVECMQKPIENNSSPGQAVYEPFSGSGTTIIAGEMTGRSIYAMELNPPYVDVAIKRWQDFTGQAAVLESSGQTFAEVAQSRYDFRKDGFESYELWCASKRGALQAAE